jgi:hypothetical protein
MAKKASKPKLKQGKYAAVITLRILPDEIQYYDALLKRYIFCKNYTDAIFRATKDVRVLSDTIEMINKQLSDCSNSLQKECVKNNELTRKLMAIKDHKHNLDLLINAIKF